MYRLPAFNLSVSIWRDGNFTYATPDVRTVGNLAWSRRQDSPNATTESYMHLLLPKLTDIRGEFNGGASDSVEVPAGSHRFYLVANVDDIGKGFSNEHRCAIITQNLFGRFGLLFPIPLP